MRRLVDGVIAAGTLAVACVVGWHVYQRTEEERRIAVATAGVREFGEAIRLHAASEGTLLTGRGWPVTVDPAWFGDSPPRNPLLSSDRAWVEVAPPEHADLSHPDQRVVSGPGIASFWYNPYQGVVRARVPMAVSDKRTLELYNRVNGTSLESILPPARAEERRPEADPDAIAQANQAPVPRPTEDEIMDPTRPEEASAEGSGRDGGK